MKFILRNKKYLMVLSFVFAVNFLVLGNNFKIEAMENYKINNFKESFGDNDLIKNEKSDEDKYKKVYKVLK